MRFSDLEDAYEFATYDGGHMGNEAWVNTKDGRVYRASVYGDFEEEEPDDFDNENWVELPTQRDLKLGQRLVHAFVDEVCPELTNKVLRIGGKGFYGRYKVLLQENDLLDDWHHYENNATQEALRRWAEEMSLCLGTNPEPPRIIDV